MRLLTDGLKLAAGPALRHLLATATLSPARGVASGVLITAVVQSSTAVIFSVIGFVNAGLMQLRQAIGVIYGSNVGTTLTSWIVALVGLRIDLQWLALPCIALGMGLWVLGRAGRRAAMGQALAGLGLFFLGLDFLKDSFTDLPGVVDLASGDGVGIGGLLLFVLIGIVLTVLMQSSSAALAVILTAAAGGALGYAPAAAMVIGANVGTTSTALLAAIGATADAQRTAAAHVLFNLVTAVAAFAALPVLLWLSVTIAQLIGAGAHPATGLAVFHTLTKLLGLAMLWPFTLKLEAFLNARFQRPEEDRAQPRYLDRLVLATPALAVDALRRELVRMGAMSIAAAEAAISAEGPGTDDLRREFAAINRLGDAIADFAAHVGSETSDETSASLAATLRVAQYYRDVAERAVELRERQPRANDLPADIKTTLDGLRRSAVRALEAADPAGEADALRAATAVRDEFEPAYQAWKARILQAGTRRELDAATLVQVLDYGSALRRAADQAGKAARYLAELPQMTPRQPAEAPAADAEQA